MLISASKVRSQKFVVIGGPRAPSYAITPSATSVTESDTISFTINTSNVSNGVVLYWTLTGTTNSGDFNPAVSSGTATISNGSAAVSLPLSADQLTEGTESFSLQLRLDSTSGPIVAQSSVITVLDTSLTRTYSIVPASESFNEGGTAFFEIFTTNVPNSTTLYWEVLNGTDPQYYSQTADFGSTSGTTTITDNYGAISIDLIADSLTEGIQKFYISLRTGSASGPIVANSSLITINDTSTAPLPTYSVSASPSPVDEGTQVTFTINTTLVSNGTTLYWTNDGTTSSGDITGGSTNGSFTINSNTGSVSLTPVADSTTEGSETIVFNVRTGSTSGTIVASTTVTVNDTSLSPVASFPINVQYLVVGGGGGAGATTRSYQCIHGHNGGGGGGGGYQDGVLPINTAGAYCVIVGAGGVGGQPCFSDSKTVCYTMPLMATNGSPSCLEGVASSQGGGSGGNMTGRIDARFSGAPLPLTACIIRCCNGNPGGSGGGGSWDYSINPGFGSGGSGSQGYPGGQGLKTYPAGGGGGGAGGPGKVFCAVNPQTQCGACGGPGRQWVNGSYYAGGGGGGTSIPGSSSIPIWSLGGIGGGGPAGAICCTIFVRSASPGSVNTGGGGGAYTICYNTSTPKAWACCPAGSGGSGVVILFYEGAQRATGGSVSCVGTCTVHTFSSSGMLCFCSGFV
jgi:hypothetical protein